jgi:amino acid transporter
MTPTYLYIGAVGAMIVIGLVRLASGDLPEFTPPTEWLSGGADGQGHGVGVEALGILLVLRAFSSGAAALTGVEAISDGVPAFKPPEWRNARITLVWATVLFASLFLGISFLASSTGIIPDPTEEQTVLSILARLVIGGGPFYIAIQVATVLVLALAANTAFADFPRLSSFLARDGYMPRQFAFRGERLAFTTGIVALSLLAATLIVVFGASVTALIPLYTLGVFIAFTLSQSGMVVRWLRRREPGWRPGVAINGLGAVTTAVIAIIVVESKFISGAWMVVIAIPLFVLLLLAIRGHYRDHDAMLALERVPESGEVAPRPIVIVPISRLDRPALQAIAFANSLDPNAVAVHVTSDPQTALALRQRWPEWARSTELVVVESPYRALVGPLLAYMDALQHQAPERPIVVVLAEFITRHWWERPLHNQTAFRLRLRLLRRRNTIVANVPYHAPPA